MLKRFFLVYFIFTMTLTFAQQNISVPLTDQVYNIIEYSEIRGYTKKLHNSRPYTLSLILDTLYTILEHPDISLNEKDLVLQTIERLSPSGSTEFTADSSLFQKIGTIGSTGSYRYENDSENIPVSVEIGANAEINIASNFNEPNISNYEWLNLFLLGDVGNNFSYKVHMGMGIMKLDYSAYEPFSFSPFWGGYLYLMENLASFAGSSEDLAAGIQLLPEFGVSVFDNKLGFNFSRITRDWGTGNGNLMLSKTSQPFVAMEMYLRPVDFISLSAITGVLEYYLENSIKTDAALFQNAYSAFMGEIFFGEYAYAGLVSSVVWPKRFELGYIIPGMIPFFYQNMVGDFDNMLFGLSLGANIPGYANFYFNVLADELNFNSENFFHKDRNMYAYQAGVRVAVPSTAFATFNFQYTKLEPYMYTHPGVNETPWYDADTIMLINYVNHGENLGYNLPPNSDQFKLVASMFPFWFLKTDISYSLIRHGVTYGSGAVDGSSVDDSLPYREGGVESLTKYFLTDGVYEWVHALGIQAELDMRFVKNIPLTFNIGYTLAYTHFTSPNVLNVSFQPLNNSEYTAHWGNYFTLSIKVW